MDCLECKNLEGVFESRVSKYIEARSAAYYRVSTELAAKKNVDMERARNDLEEHKLICIPAAEARPPGPRVLRALSENRSRRLRGTPSFSHAKTISELKETRDPKLRQLFPRDMRCLLAEADPHSQRRIIRGTMAKKKVRRVPPLPVELPSTMSMYEKESREAEAKLHDARADKPKPA